MMVDHANQIMVAHLVSSKKWSDEASVDLTTVRF